MNDIFRSSSDPDSWLEKYGDNLYRFALKYVKSSTVAEDLVQDTLLAALKGRDSFKGTSTEETWMIGILNNKIKDHFRKVTKDFIDNITNLNIDDEQLDYITDGTLAGSWQANSRPKEWGIDPSDPVENDQFWIHLNNCLDSIDQRLALIYSLRDIHQVDYEEVCNILSLQATNARVMLYRARKLLRKCLEKNWIDDLDE